MTIQIRFQTKSGSKLIRSHELTLYREVDAAVAVRAQEGEGRDEKGGNREHGRKKCILCLTVQK